MRRNTSASFLIIAFLAIISGSCSEGPNPVSPSTPQPVGPPPATGPLAGTEVLSIPVLGSEAILRWWIMSLQPELGGTFVDYETRVSFQWACVGPVIVTQVYLATTFSDGPGTPEFGRLERWGGPGASNGVCNGHPYGVSNNMIMARSQGGPRTAISYLRFRLWLNKAAPEGDPDGVIDIRVNWTAR